MKDKKETKKETGKTMWICPVCGYEVESSKKPELCPVCGYASMTEVGGRK